MIPVRLMDGIMSDDDDDNGMKKNQIMIIRSKSICSF